MDKYSVGKWAGKDKYQCKICPFDSLSLETIMKHIKTHEVTRESKILDNKGEKIIIKE